MRKAIENRNAGHETSRPVEINSCVSFTRLLFGTFVDASETSNLVSSYRCVADNVQLDAVSKTRLDNLINASAAEQKISILYERIGNSTKLLCRGNGQCNF